jgi:LysM repeat protein
MKILLFILLLFPVLAFAQKTYTVGPKETLFSIGRSLNIHPRELAEYNNISFETGVKIGQVLKIPAVKKMADQ